MRASFDTVVEKIGALYYLRDGQYTIEDRPLDWQRRGFAANGHGVRS